MVLSSTDVGKKLFFRRQLGNVEKSTANIVTRPPSMAVTGERRVSSCERCPVAAHLLGQPFNGHHASGVYLMTHVGTSNHGKI